jgi:polysaccharide biosynthesis/export protein
LQAKILKLINVFLIIGFSAVSGLGQETGSAPPKELLDYIQDARKAHIDPSEIQQNLIKAGWQAELVNAALASLDASEKEKSKAGDEQKSQATGIKASSKAAQPEESSGGAAKAPLAADIKNAPAPAAPAGTPDAATSKEAPSPVLQDVKTAPPATPTQPTEPGGSPAANVVDDYKIGAGDVLKITVWHEPDASLPSAVVLPNGRISVPLLHDIEVAGLTVPQLEKLLTGRLSALIDTPEVSVVITAANSKKIYLSGKVKKEGPLSYTYTMTVMQALTEAGGVTDFAKKKNIYVLRTENGRQFKLPFDLAAVLKGEHLEENIQLIPGDMIVVP